MWRGSRGSSSSNSWNSLLALVLVLVLSLPGVGWLVLGLTESVGCPLLALPTFRCLEGIGVGLGWAWIELGMELVAT